MIRTENECVGCPKEMGCLGSGCPYTHVPHLFCDKCGQEAASLFDTDDGQLCYDCVEGDTGEYTVITGDNAWEFTSPEEQDYGDPDRAYEMKRDERWKEEHG